MLCGFKPWCAWSLVGAGLTVANMQRTYGAPGVYTIEYHGPITTASFAVTNAVCNKCLTGVTQWSSAISPTTMSFRGAANLIAMVEPPHTVTSMASMFQSATSFNQPITSWDTSKVISISLSLPGT